MSRASAPSRPPCVTSPSFRTRWAACSTSARSPTASGSRRSPCRSASSARSTRRVPTSPSTSPRSRCAPATRSCSAAARRPSARTPLWSRAMRGALAERGVDPEAIQTVDDFGRDGARELMQARGIVDVLVPRGSAQLIETVVTESLVPVIETGAGVVHIVLDESAPLEWARDIVVNAKIAASERVQLGRDGARPPGRRDAARADRRRRADRPGRHRARRRSRRGAGGRRGAGHRRGLVDGVSEPRHRHEGRRRPRRGARAHPPLLDAPHRVDHHAGRRPTRSGSSPRSIPPW